MIVSALGKKEKGCGSDGHIGFGMNQTIHTDTHRVHSKLFIICVSFGFMIIVLLVFVSVFRFSLTVDKCVYCFYVRGEFIQ